MNNEDLEITIGNYEDGHCEDYNEDFIGDDNCMSIGDSLITFIMADSFYYHL